MKLLSLNVGRAKAVDVVEESKKVTGIDKRPVAGPVRVAAPGPKGVGASGVAGDAVCNTEHHGGDDQAVYAFAREDLDDWERELGRTLPSGVFGENLTTEGLLEAQVGIGDRFRIGSALLEVSQPRIPCHKLAMRHARPDLPKHFLASGRSGLYFRVIEAGEVGRGDAIERDTADPRGLSVADVLAFARSKGEPEQLRRAAAHPALAEVWRAELDRRLRKLENG